MELETKNSLGDLVDYEFRLKNISLSEAQKFQLLLESLTEKARRLLDKNEWSDYEVGLFIRPRAVPHSENNAKKAKKAKITRSETKQKDINESFPDELWNDQPLSFSFPESISSTSTDGSLPFPQAQKHIKRKR
jgi:hypothetical protein